VKACSFAYTELGSRRVGILAQDNPFGVEHTEDFTRAFEQLGGTIVGIETFALSEKDVRSQITKIEQEEPDTIFNLHATGPMMGLLVKQARELGVDVNWLGSFGAENDDLVSQYGEVIDGIIYPYPYDANGKDTASKEFIENYQQKFNELPELTSASAYDTVKILAQAIEESGEDSLKVKEYLLQVRDYPGVSGTISFDKNGDVKKPILIKQVKDSEFVTLSS